MNTQARGPSSMSELAKELERLVWACHEATGIEQDNALDAAATFVFNKGEEIVAALRPDPPEDVKDKARVSDDLAAAMESAIKRFETIQETNPEISLEGDLAYYREALSWYRRIPSLERREAVWNQHPDPPADMVEVWDRLKNHLWQITKLNDDDAPYMRSIAKDTLQALSAINLPALLAAEREKGQREGKIAVCGWLRGLSAQKPNPPLASEAARLADSFEQSEIPAQAIRERKGS